MSTGHSFTEYVANRFYNELFAAVGSYVEDNFASLDLRSYAVKYIDSATLSDITVKRVYVGPHAFRKNAIKKYQTYSIGGCRCHRSV